MRTKEAIDDLPIPEYVRDLFGAPPILREEDADLYWTFMQRTANAVKPTDIIEWLWLKDCVDLCWEILRLRRLKTGVVEINRDREIGKKIDPLRESCQLLTHYSTLTIYERAEKLLTAAELRRDRILREIELRRDHMGRRLRAASAEILQAQAATPSIAAE